MNHKLILSVLSALVLSSCSVCTHSAVADYGRSADAILLPLENPTLYCVNDQWYMGGQKANIERYNSAWVKTDKLPYEKRHPERYALGSDEMSPMYSPIPKDLAESIQKGKYTHSQAISFINREWVAELPEGEVKKVRPSTSAPDFFRKMSSHRLMQTESGTYLLADIGEMTADFNSIIVYPMAGLCAILIDAPASFFYSPPTEQKQEAQPEELE
ncbi:MAG: hypothetical protein IJE88_00825 [Akkermansia sp.]|nr:hypothetical protein [Akkermansia sp.]